MLGPLLSKLSVSEQTEYLSNEKRIEEAEQAVLSCSEVLDDLEAKLKEAKKKVFEKTQELHALYADRQSAYDKVFGTMNILPSKPPVLIHGVKEEFIKKSTSFGNMTIGSCNSKFWLACNFPVYMKTDDGLKEAPLEVAKQYWSDNCFKLIR
jgi:hypothetical protein